MLSIAGHYRSVVDELPGALQPLARQLPRRLALSERPEGGWEDYTRLPLMHDLPSFAAEGVALSQASLEGGGLC